MNYRKLGVDTAIGVTVIWDMLRDPVLAILSTRRIASGLCERSVPAGLSRVSDVSGRRRPEQRTPGHDQCTRRIHRIRRDGLYASQMMMIDEKRCELSVTL